MEQSRSNLRRCKHTRTGRWTDCEGIERCERCWAPVDDKTKLEEDINQGGSLIQDHPFVPRRKAEPWGLCECGLGEAAHADSKLAYRTILAARRRENEATKDRKVEPATEYYNQGRVIQLGGSDVRDQSRGGDH
jgi:hypothetical protein